MTTASRVTADIERLNPQQRQAVLATEGRVLVLAGAGSGKTRVLTVRIAYLIGVKGVDPTQILGLTFTNKAAAEMRERLAQMVDPALAKQVTLCTFHSFCMRVLRAEAAHIGYQKNFTLYDENDIQRLATSIARDILGHEGRDMPSIGQAMNTISMARNKGLKPEEIQDTGSDWHDEFVRKLYARLERALRSYNAMDFDSLLTLTVKLFQENPEVLERYQERFRYLMIDEYQDTNPIQYQLAALLSKKYQNLCVVGDDDQSIYGWRGADVKNILEFGDATVVRLEQNYRSTNVILNAANSVIGNNSARHDKQLWSTCNDGPPIEVFHAPTEADEAEAVVKRIVNFRKNSAMRWKDMAILYRSNALSRQMEQALLKHYYQDGKEWKKGIPYKIYGGTAFYERREVKDILAYLRVIINPKDQEALLRVINLPRRGIGDTSLELLSNKRDEEKRSLWSTLEGVQESWGLSAKALAGVQGFVETIHEAKDRFGKDPLGETLTWLVKTIDYQRAIADDVKSEKMRRFKWENVQELVSAITEYEQRSENPTLEDFAQETIIENDMRNKAKDKGHDHIHLMTFHSAKGLEFPACFLVGLEDHIIPHEKSMQETGLEEERRLMYVALTRAKRYLTLSMAQQRMRMGKTQSSRPSRFLFEIPKDLLSVTRWK